MKILQEKIHQILKGNIDLSWNDICVDDNCFLKQLDNKFEEKYTSLKGIFLLSFEAQWEYATRGGKA